MQTKYIEIGKEYGMMEYKHATDYTRVKVVGIDPKRRIKKYGSFAERTTKTIEVERVHPWTKETVRKWVRPHDIRLLWEEVDKENQHKREEAERAREEKRDIMEEGEELASALVSAWGGAFPDLDMLPVSNKLHYKGTLYISLTPKYAKALIELLERS